MIHVYEGKKQILRAYYLHLAASWLRYPQSIRMSGDKVFAKAL